MASMVSSEGKASIENNSTPVDEIQKQKGDEEFGGTEERKRIERKLLWKLDCRMSVMIVIYILNYVRSCIPFMPGLLKLMCLQCTQIDRNNASAARLRGFEADLKLKGSFQLDRPFTWSGL